MPALSALDLVKSFGPQVVLAGASFTLARGEKVGLIGKNGAGKSTVARIVAGLEAPDGGQVSVRRGLSVRYLEQEPELDEQRTARELVEDALSAWRDATTRHAEVTAALEHAEGDAALALVTEQAELGERVAHLGGWNRGHEAQGFLDKLGVADVDRVVAGRSGGEKRRIALAQLLVASPDVAILDEPTNHLDVETASWLEGYLARELPGAVLLVTHDRYFLDAVATRIVELDDGKLTTYDGNYGTFLEKKAEAIEHQARVEQNLKNVYRREKAWLMRGAKARTTKQKARIDRANALGAEIEQRRLKRPDELELTVADAARQGKTVLEAHGLAVSPAPGVGALHAPFDLVLGTRDRLGIVGPNGAGKTTLLRALLAAADEARTGTRPAGAPVVVAGRIVAGKNTRVAYLDQARETLDDAKSIFDEVRGDGATVVSLGDDRELELRSYLEMFLFDGHKQRQKVGSLSGGERARVALAKVLRQGANLLVLDEPTNDLDLPTLSALEELLETYAGAVLVVTHDRAFLDETATAILAFERGPAGAPATVTRYAGGYQDYVAQRAAVLAPRAPRATDAPKKAASPAPAPAGEVAAPDAPPRAEKPKKSALTYAERLELDGLLDRIDEAERGVAAAEAALADPSLYATRAAEAPKLEHALKVAKESADALVARWETLEAKKAGG